MLKPAQNTTISRLEGNDKVAGPIEIELGAAASPSPSLVAGGKATLFLGSQVSISRVSDGVRQTLMNLCQGQEHQMELGHDFCFFLARLL